MLTHGEWKIHCISGLVLSTTALIWPPIHAFLFVCLLHSCPFAHCCLQKQLTPLQMWSQQWLASCFSPYLYSIHISIKITTIRTTKYQLQVENLLGFLHLAYNPLLLSSLMALKPMGGRLISYSTLSFKWHV